MPPKFKFTKEQIIESAFKLVRQKGWRMLSTRMLAEELGSSSRPIYSFFRSMEDLEEEIVRKAVDLLHEYMVEERTGDPWQDHGIGYVMFARKESHLFRAVNEPNHIKYYKQYGEIVWASLSASLSDYPPFRGLSDEQIYEVQLTRWLLAHGLAFQVSTHAPGVWEDDHIALVMQRGSTALLEGLNKEFFSN